MSDKPQNYESLTQLQARFETILPRIQKQAGFAFRYLKRENEKEEAIAETIALCWRWFLRLAKRGKDATAFPTVLANYASRHVKGGRHLCGQESSKDALSDWARKRRGFRVERLREVGPDGNVTWQEALIDNTMAPVHEVAAFRIDFPRWLGKLRDRDQQIAEKLALNYRTEEVRSAIQSQPRTCEPATSGIPGQMV